MNYIKCAFWYWLICCIVVGASEGKWRTKCPNDPPVTTVETVAFVLIAPAMVKEWIEDNLKVEPLPKTKVEP